MDIDKKAIGARIKSIRLEKGLTLHEFGDLIGGADRSIASRWERGVSLPNNARLKEIADLGGISIVELLHGPLKSYAHDRITELINDEKDYELTEETREEIINSAVNQSLKNTFANMFYAIGEFSTVDNELSHELTAAIKRKFTKTEFTNNGLLIYSSSELSAIKSGVDKYLDNGVDKDLYNDVQRVLSHANNEIASLHVKHKDKLN